MKFDALEDCKSNLAGTTASVHGSIERVANFRHVRSKISTNLINIWRGRASTSWASVVVVEHVYWTILSDNDIRREVPARFQPVLS